MASMNVSKTGKVGLKGSGVGKAPTMPSRPFGGMVPTRPGANPKGTAPKMIDDSKMGAGITQSVPKFPLSGGAGVVSNYGGDKHSYLGHFRSADNMSKGHNNFVGAGMAPGQRVNKVARSGVAVNAATNPLLAAKVDRRRNVIAARESSPAGSGAVKAARQAAAPAVAAAKQTRAAMTSKDKLTQSSALKSTLMGATNALKGQRQNMAKAMRGKGAAY